MPQMLSGLLEEEKKLFSLSGLKGRAIQPVAWAINSTTQTRRVSATLDGSFCEVSGLIVINNKFF